jgi:probable F420-dependent oxidoreductase
MDGRRCVLSFGVHIALTAESIDPSSLALLLEQHDVDALYVPEHTHIPVHGASLHPDGGRPTERLSNFLDPCVTLAAVATATSRVRLATGVCLVPQHDPLVLAKVVASLDVISHGRVELGIGAGWNREEMRNHGTAPEARWAVMREHVLAMRALWTSHAAEFHGAHVDFDPVWQWPKPVQHPGPPVLIGGEGPRVLDRVLDYGDGWAPNAEPGIAERIGELRRRAGAFGRAEPLVTVMHVPEDLDTIARYEAAGATCCVFTLPSAANGEVQTILDRQAELVVRYRAPR